MGLGGSGASTVRAARNVSVKLKIYGETSSEQGTARNHKMEGTNVRGLQKIPFNVHMGLENQIQGEYVLFCFLFMFFELVKYFIRLSSTANCSDFDFNFLTPVIVLFILDTIFHYCFLNRV